MNMIGFQESKDLFSLLTAESRPFDEIFNDFCSLFQRHHRFKICSSLAMLLKEKMLKASERLVAYAILHQTYSSQSPSLNPFISFLMDAACDDVAEQVEKAFIQLLLGSVASHNGPAILEMSAADYIKAFDSSSYVLLPREQLQKEHGFRVPTEHYNTQFRSAAVINVVPDPDIPSGCDPNSLEFNFVPPGAKPKIGYGDRDSAITDLLQNLSLEGLGPQWIRPLPPRFPVLEGELMWLNPDNNHEFLWDHGMCEATFRDLIAKALKDTLTPAEEEKIVEELNKDLKLVYHCGITPQNLPKLVDSSSIIAVHILRELMKSAERDKYLSALVNMNISPYSMETVHLLLHAVDIPRKYMKTYIKNCISACMNAKEDKYLQCRLVRLVSVFLTCNIGDKIINVQDVIAEVQAFCIEFPKIKEAASLFKLLKSLK